MRAVKKLTEAAPAEAFSGWETEFLSDLGQRLETYGSAFRYGAKGDLEDALSRLQHAKLKEIAAKAKGKARKPMGWKRKAPAKPPEDDA
jgi:hypothetical protein